MEYLFEYVFGILVFQISLAFSYLVKPMPTHWLNKRLLLYIWVLMDDTRSPYKYNCSEIYNTCLY